MDDARTWIQKADMALGDLTTDGGVLVPEQAKLFLKKLIASSTILPKSRVLTMKNPERRVEKVGFTSARVLAAGTSGSAVGSGSRVAPDLSRDTLTSKLLKGECDIPKEVFEDNIEGKKFLSTVTSLMVERAGLDLDELFLNGYISGGDSFLGILDGWITKATSNVYAAGGDLVSKDVFKAMWATVPKAHRKNKKQMVNYVGSDAESEYADQIGERGTPAGDRAAIEGMAPKWQGMPIVGVPVMPEDGGNGHDETTALMGNPKNFIVGFQRKVEVEHEVSKRDGVVYILISVRTDCTFGEEEGIAKGTGITYA